MVSPPAGDRPASSLNVLSPRTSLQDSTWPAAKTPRVLYLVLSLIGFTAVIAQILLMRELLVVFYGNELALGVVLANWLLWTALGASLFGVWAGRTRYPRRLMAVLQVLVAFTLPMTLLTARPSKALFQSVTGEILGPVPTFLTAFVTLSIFCLVSGGLFAAGSRVFADFSGASTATASGAVYLLEAVGSGAGGLLAGVALIRLTNAFAITALLGVLNLAAAWTLLVLGRVKDRVIAATFALLAVLLVLFGYTFQPFSLARLWKGYQLAATENSVYGSLAVVGTGASRSLLENGLIVMTVPDPAAAEEAVHFALLEHPEPRRILLIGGGINGSVTEALAHPSLVRVDYVELDPAIFDLAARFFPAAWEQIRNNPRVRVHATDGRRFLKSTRDDFDVIIINLPDPHTAQINRFYTKEFFHEAAARLRPGGILSFQLTASENYISEPLADFLRCLNLTLRQVFPEVLAIPGETVHFFAAIKPGTLTADPRELVRRLRARHLHTQYVREYFLPFRMSPDRMQDLQLQIEPMPSTPVNHDFVPVAYYFDVALWSAPYHPGSSHWFKVLAAIRFRTLAACVLGSMMGLAPLIWLWPAEAGGKPIVRARRSAVFAVAAMGFTELGLEIFLLLGFQALYGYIYQELTILIALFMVGMALGGWWEMRERGSLGHTSFHRDTGRLAGFQILLAVSPMLLYGLFVQLEHVRTVAGQLAASEFLFPLLSLAAGFLGGYQFLVASRVYFADPHHLGGPAEPVVMGSEAERTAASANNNPHAGARKAARSSGVLYAFDLAGACAGALGLSIFLIPIYGFFHTAVVMAVLNLAPMVMTVWCGRDR